MAGLYVRLYKLSFRSTKLVEQEAHYNIRRLRNHASIAMWCGNNEIIEAIKYWGWDKKFSKEVHQGMFTGYNKLFRTLLPNW